MRGDIEFVGETADGEEAAEPTQLIGEGRSSAWRPWPMG